MLIKNGRELRKAVKQGAWAWPGGYPIYFIASDGAPLSFEAVAENLEQCAEATQTQDKGGWCIVAADINWEDTELTCEHKGVRIPSAYGNPS